jgi:hypothetical protein
MENANKLPTVAISSENLEALLGSGTPKDPKLSLVVEGVLPMLAANDADRLRLAGTVEPIAKPVPQSLTGMALPVEAVAMAVEPIAVEEAANQAVQETVDADGGEEIVEVADELEHEAEPSQTPSSVARVSAPWQGSTPVASVRTVAPPAAQQISLPANKRAVESALAPPQSPMQNIGSTLFAEAEPPPTAEQIASSRARIQFFRWIAPGVVLLLIASGITAYLLVSRQPKTAQSATAIVPQAITKFPLHLDVEMQANGQVSVRWNPADDIVVKSREGRLVITEQDQAPRTVPLTREQLGIGHFSYQPSTERLEIRLEVVDQAGAVTGESVLAMSPKAAAAVRSAGLGQTPGAVNANTGIPLAGGANPRGSPFGTPMAGGLAVPNQPASATPQSIPNSGVSTEEPPRTRTAPRAFTPPATPQRSEEIRTVILEPPAIAAAATTLPAGMATPGMASFAAPPVGSVPSGPTASRIRVGGNIQAGLLVKRVTPVYPAVAKSARVQGIVRFSATISKDGRIQDLQAIGGPMILIPPAVEAVKQWVYRPTLLNGQPVEVVTQIDVNFTLGQ